MKNPDIKTPEDFTKFVKEVEARDGYRRPLAFGIGIARLSQSGKMLDTYFPHPNYQENFGSAAVLADVVGHTVGTLNYILTPEHKEEILQRFWPFLNDGKEHPNIDVVLNLFNIFETSGVEEDVVVVVSFIGQPEDDLGSLDVSDSYLRLHLLSHRRVKPNGIKLDNIFNKLPNVLWTDRGPMDPEDIQKVRYDTLRWHRPVQVLSMDKFPPMLNYVVPSGVRIADGSRVRLGAYLAEGTVVMHEGFVNFNAGTLGTSMVEGRISQGVVVGDQTDIGGGVSTQGTLSGGGKEKLRIGRGCLLGANAGTGISLGDLCVIEAGLYITPGMKVLYNGKVVKALELSGKDGITFLRNSWTGQVQALDKPNNVELNEVLHDNN